MKRLLEIIAQSREAEARSQEVADRAHRVAERAERTIRDYGDLGGASRR